MYKRVGYKQCDECGNNSHFDTKGWGTDEYGDIMYLERSNY
ncbi:hypothetical protein [Clostridium botulinum]|uniref:Uncharacterized protein n=1 Tax=Clostridium botulinum TaxID=1491 RepID=A0A077K0Q1_CLOBO|nr:hypothetical protein [Clostridium botulinum]BAP25756.1 hypothetical protein [Clostridium botulinum]